MTLSRSRGISRARASTLTVLRGVGCCALLLAAGAGEASAQLVLPKTLPVHQDDQFAIFPSARGAMGGVRLALDDTLLDPYVNPATLQRVRRTTWSLAPFLHGVSGSGSGATLPLAGIVRRGAWTALGSATVQSQSMGASRFGRDLGTARNWFAQASLARALPGGVSVGASAYRAALNGITGINRLYANAERIEQAGSITDVRLGASGQWTSRTAELLVVHNRYDVRHDVDFAASFPVRTGSSTRFEERRWSEHNVDRTAAWSLHGEVAQAFADGWRVGAQVTGTRLSHPKIPNYTIMNIPRDPGTTYGAQIGAGVGYDDGVTTLGLDVILEPMSSNTWVEAERDTVTALGRPLARGARTIENDFLFRNRIVRLGFARTRRASIAGEPDITFQLGLTTRHIDYRLNQENHLGETRRGSHNSWTEWSPSGGLRFDGGRVAALWSVRMTCARGEDCLPLPRGDRVTVAAPVGGGVVAAPSRTLDLNAGTAFMTQLTFVVPVGRK